MSSEDFQETQTHGSRVNHPQSLWASKALTENILVEIFIKRSKSTLQKTSKPPPHQNLVFYVNCLKDIFKRHLTQKLFYGMKNTKQDKLIKYDIVRVISDTDQAQLDSKLLKGKDGVYTSCSFVPAHRLSSGGPSMISTDMNE